MSNQETIEIDPDELSKDVVDELVEKDIMNEEQAEDVGDEVWLDEVSDKNPEKASSLEYISSLISWVSSLITKFGVGLKNKFISSGKGTGNYISDKVEILKRRTIFADVVSVEPKQNRDSPQFFNNKDKESEKVVVTLNHNEIDEFEVEFELNSTELSNIMEYNSVDNPKELEGEKLMLSRNFDSRYNKPGIIIPHNVSTSGKIRFKMYSLGRQVFKKTRIKHLYSGPLDDIIFAYIISGMATLFLTAGTSGTVFGILGIIPAIIWTSVVGFHTIHFVFSVINATICLILRSNYKDIKKQR